jgi:hypothetical protein
MCSLSLPLLWKILLVNRFPFYTGFLYWLSIAALPYKTFHQNEKVNSQTSLPKRAVKRAYLGKAFFLYFSPNGVKRHIISEIQLRK